MKMMNNKTSLALAVAAALGVMSQQASAVIKLNFDSTSDTSGYVTSSAPAVPRTSGAIILTGPMLFAAEQSGESSLGLNSIYAASANKAGIVWADGDLSVAIPVPSSYAVVGVKTMFIKVALTGGAKFYAEPYLVCPNKTAGATPNTLANTTTATDMASAGDGATIIATKGGLISTATSPAAGKATAVFNIVSGLTTIATGFCTLTFALPADVSTTTMVTAYTVGNRGDIGMNVEVGYTQGGAPATALVSGTIIKFVPKLKATVTASEFGNVVSPVVIDVKQASKKFVAAGAAVTQSVATLGSIRVTSATTAILVRAATLSASDTTASVIMNTGTVTINGALLAGVQNVTLHKVASCGTLSTAPAGVPSTSTGGGGNVTIAGISIGELAAGLNICTTVPGTTTLNGGQLTAVLTGGDVTNFAPTLGPEGNLVNVGINGARVRILQIPSSTNTDLAFIRFYNTSSQNTIVRGTLYGMDGKVIGTENSVLFDALKSNDVEVLDAAKLQTKIGATSPWTGKAWLLVQAEVEPASFKVQGLLRTPANILVNLSTDALN